MEIRNSDKICRRCPICGTLAFPNYTGYDFCPECKWEDDVYEPYDDLDSDMTCNDVSIREAREAYRCGLNVWELDRLKREGKELSELGLKHVRECYWDSASE